MISKYLKFKNIIDQINPTINEEELKNDINNPYYHLKSSDQSSFIITIENYLMIMRYKKY